MTDKTVPLPEPALTHDRHGAMLLIGPCFTADQLHAYGDARVAAERARWRALCEQALAALVWEAGSEPSLYAAQTGAAIAAIRAQLGRRAHAVLPTNEIGGAND